MDWYRPPALAILMLVSRHPLQDRAEAVGAVGDADHVRRLRADDLHHVVRRVGALVSLDQHVHRGPHLGHAGEVPLGNRLLQQFQPQVEALAHAA